MDEIDDDYISNAYKFTIVRNPYDRTVSAFRYIQKHNKIPKNISFSTFWTSNHPLQNEPHFGVQCDCICDVSGNSILDYIGRYENLKETWNTISNSIGNVGELSHLNKVNITDHYKTWYNNVKCKETVELKCLKDLKYFRYSL